MMQGAERLLTCPTLTSLSREVYGPGIIKDLARLIFLFFFIIFFCRTCLCSWCDVSAVVGGSAN